MSELKVTINLNKVSFTRMSTDVFALFQWFPQVIYSVVGWFCLCFISAADASVELMAQEISSAYEEKQPMPCLSQKYSIDLSTAYQIQRAFVRSRLQSDSIVGFKAGLTSDDAQAEFEINRPIIGILFKSGEKQHNDTFSIKHSNGMMIEAELGFVFKKRIYRKVNSIQELKSYVDKIIPVLELPEVVFESDKINVADLVAVNTGSAYFIPKDGVNWLGQDINQLTVTLRQNDQIVLQGQGKDAIGDQWEALRWLVNQIVAYGWVIEKGHLLITGALGGMAYIYPGTYTALYNHEIAITFTVTEGEMLPKK